MEGYDFFWLMYDCLGNSSILFDYLFDKYYTKYKHTLSNAQLFQIIWCYCRDMIDYVNIRLIQCLIDDAISRNIFKDARYKSLASVLNRNPSLRDRIKIDSL